MMAVSRRLWDSNLVLSYLSGDTKVQPDCDLIIEQAKGRQLELVVSTIALAEVAFLKGLSDSDSEAKIQEFFSRDYIVPVLYDITVAKIARGLIRTYRPGFKPADAVHMATALLWQIPILETTDPDLLRLDRKEGNPPLIIRAPKYEGSQPLPGFKV